MIILLYGSEIVVWREKERSRIRIAQIDNLRDLLDIRIVCEMHMKKQKYSRKKVFFNILI